MSSFLQIGRDGAIVTVRMNHPETRNALTSPEQIQEFVDLCAELRRDPSARVMVLTGNGSAFCAGGNVKDMRSREGIFAGSPFELRNTYRDGIQRIPLALYELDIPVIAAVNGPAIGAGLDLACMCDIRLASSSALFAESFVRLGIVPGDGGAWLLPRIIGIPKASLMAFTGDTIDAAKALEWGWWSRFAPMKPCSPKHSPWRSVSPVTRGMPCVCASAFCARASTCVSIHCSSYPPPTSPWPITPRITRKRLRRSWTSASRIIWIVEKPTELE